MLRMQHSIQRFTKSQLCVIFISLVALFIYLQSGVFTLLLAIVASMVLIIPGVLIVLFFCDVLWGRPENSSTTKISWIDILRITTALSLATSIIYVVDQDSISLKHPSATHTLFVRVFWSPWFISSTCLIIPITTAGVMCIGRNELLPNPHNFWALIASTVFASVAFIISMAAIIDMMVLCFFVPKDKDSRLTVPLLLLIPLSRVLSWSGLFLILWGWDTSSWSGIPNANPYIALIRLASHTASFIVIYDANTTLLHAFAGLFAYEFYVIIIPITIAVSVSYVSEHTKIGDHKQIQYVKMK